MKVILKTILVGLIVFFGFFYGYAEDWTEETSIVVVTLTIEAEAEVEESKMNTLTDLLENALINEGSFQVLERDVLEDVLSEKELKFSGLTESETADKVGDLIGASKIITGAVSKMNEKFIITIKGVDVATGAIEVSEVVAFNSVSGLLKGLSIVADRFVQKAMGNEVEDSENDKRLIDLEETKDDSIFVDLSDSEQKTVKNIDTIIDKRYFLKDAGLLEMKKESEDLDFVYRYAMFEENRKSFLLMFTLNLVPSLGSWVVGDYKGAIITDIGLALGATSVLVFNSQVTTYIGLGVLGLSYLYNLWRPFKFVPTWNKTLKEGLNITYEPVISQPEFTAVKNIDSEYEWKFNFSLINYEF